MSSEFSLVTIVDDITKRDVEAVVNAANTTLLGGGGVDGAIHRAAGPGLLDECRRLGGCPPGEARLTGGYDLAADWVIHTVGPIWRGGESGEAEVLASCYRSAIEIAHAHQMRSIAFPAISTGAFGYPMDEATRIAVTTVAESLAGGTSLDRVEFVCFDQRSLATYVPVVRGVEGGAAGPR